MIQTDSHPLALQKYLAVGHILHSNLQEDLIKLQGKIQNHSSKS
jgi:hypothetical protein